MSPQHAIMRMNSQTTDGWGQLAAAPAKGNAAPQAPLKRLHRLLRGRYGLALALAAICAIGGATAGYMAQKPKFRAIGLIEIQPVIRSPIRDDKMMLMYQQYVQNQVALLTGPRVIGAALASREWAETHRGGAPEMQETFVENMDVSILLNTTLVRVSYLDTDRSVAVAAVQALIRSYQQIYGDVSTDEYRRKMDILERQKQSQSNLIRVKRDMLQDLASKIGTPDVTAYHNEKLKNLAGLESQLAQATFVLEGMEALVKRTGAPTTAPSNAKAGKDSGTELPRAAKLTDEEIATVDPTMRELLRQQREAGERARKLSSMGFGPGYRAVQEARADLTNADDMVKAHGDDFRARYVAIQTDPATQLPQAIGASTIDMMHARVSSLQALYDREKDMTTQLGKRKIEMQALENDVEKLKEDLETTDRAITQLAAETMMSGNLNVVSPGDSPLTPAVDRRKQFAALGLVGGGMLPFGVLMLVGLLDTRHRYSDEVTADLDGISLLGILPDLPDLDRDPTQASVAAHCVHQIRTMLQLSSEAEDRRVFAVTSPSPGDGKTSLTLALGLSFSSTGLKTLMIDFDLIGGGLTARMSVGRPMGLAEAIASRSMMNYVVPSDSQHLSLLPVGSNRAGASMLVTPASVARLIAEARQNFDVVLIDTGPILGAIEASPIAVAADGVILTVSRGQSRGMVERSLAHLLSIGATISGLVFNRAKHSDFQRSMAQLSMDRMPSGNGAVHAEVS